MTRINTLFIAFLSLLLIIGNTLAGISVDVIIKTGIEILI